MFDASFVRRGLCLALSLTFVPLQASAAPAPPISREPAAAAARHRLDVASGSTLLSDSFGESASAANVWKAIGGACLTAGTSATPATSIPACGANASQDAAGSGTLQLTALAKNSGGMVVYQTPLSTANGLVITFSYAAFGGGSPGADGITSFLTDASAAEPAAIGANGGALGYAGSPGIANAYLGIGYDSFGGFSSSNAGQSGGPGMLSDTIALRGAASTTYAYLGGYTSGGQASSLPFALNSPSSTTRPATYPTVQETLTAAGAVTVAIDRHDGNGLVTYESQTISGASGEPAVPAKVYLGFTGTTGGSYEVHQISGLTVTTISGGTASPTPSPSPTASATPVTTPAPLPSASSAPPASTIVNETFTLSSTGSNVWGFSSDSCLTAGTASTPSTSIPACGSAAPADASGSGALLLTTSATGQRGFLVYKTPVSTSAGLHVRFNDSAFHGTSPGADGVVLFLTDASKPIPTGPGGNGGSMGYGDAYGATGLANAFLGIAFDEFGNFSSSATGNGGPGSVAQTIAVRGTAAGNYSYLGGYQSGGKAASLPFALDAPAATTRPANPPTFDVVLSQTGVVTVSIDRHDGAGLVAYYTQNVVGVAGQPALPAKVFVGLTASSGGNYEGHQVSGFTLATAMGSTSNPTPTPLPSTSATPSPAPTPSSGASFSPAKISNLAAWYDAANTASITQSGGTVSAWNDLSGHGNTLAQTTASMQPGYTATGIDNLGSLTFSGGPFLLTNNTSFSPSLFNESTTFFVTNQSNASQSSSIASTGVASTSPRWDLRLSEGGVSHFDFNNKAAGRLGPSDVPNGPAVWTAEGSLSGGSEQLRKDGNVLASSTGPGGSSVSGNYPLIIGATTTGAGTAATYTYTGQLGEAIVYNRALSASETAEVEGYLACKWGLQNRLPANHPYRSSCPQGGTSTPIPSPAPSAGVLTDPTQVRSSNGQLTFNVTATQDSNGNPKLSYNGSTVPPTLRLVPGDTLIVNLTNNLPTPPSGAQYKNDTNLHYHGLHVNPNAPGDDSIDLFAMPGQSVQYKIVIPANHPTGLYWYHSHSHGEAERQNLSGMSGALIIDGISQYAPQVANMPERILIARDVLPAGKALPAANKNQVAAMYWAMQHSTVARNGIVGKALAHAAMNPLVRGNTTAKTRNPYVVVNPRYRYVERPADSTTGHCVGTETPVTNWTINGQSAPKIGIRPGEKQFWRLVNAGSDSYLDLQVDNATMQVVALDGVPLASAGSPALTVSHYVIPPASRIEFVVTGPASGTTSYLRTNCFDAGSTGNAMPAATLAQLDPASSLTDNIRMRDRISKAAARGFRHTAAYIRRFVSANATSLRQQTIAYSDQFTINGVAYDPGAPAAFYAQSGTMEQWQIVNNSTQVHTFHIHQVHFLVDQIVGGTAIEQSNIGQVLDNINVPAANANGPGTVTLTMDFTDPAIVGTFLLHCHILSHEDAGMMAKITVGTAPPLTVNPSSVTFASATAAAQNVTVSGGKTPYSLTGCANVANAGVSGSTVKITPTAAGNCVLTIADSSGLTANVEVTVTPPAAVVKVTPNSLAFSSPTAAAQSSTISGGTAPYTVAGCTNVAKATVSSATITVTPSAAGSCSVTVTDAKANTASLSVAVNAAQTGAAVDNLTFHHDTARTGWYKNETQLTAANVSGGKFKLLTSLKAPSGMPAMGKVYAQPLYATSETINGVSHNLIVVSTMTDQIYAFDDKTDAVVWHRDFTNPSGGITQQNYADTACQDVNPDIGIASTGVIDRSTDRMYTTVHTKENGAWHIRLHAISLQTGADVVSPVEVSASTMLASGGAATTNAEYNFSRAGLLQANGNIYVALTSHCDYHQETTHGWILAYSASSLAPVGTSFNTTNTNAGNTYFLGSIWMSGYGPAADSSGNVYTATGNGPFDGVNNFSMSALKLPGNLNLAGASYFAPADAASETANDNDLASGGVMVLPDGLVSSLPHLLVAGGKNGVKYVLNRDKLGGQQTGDVGTVWNATTGGHMWGGPAFFQDSSNNSWVVYGNGHPLSTYLLSPSNGTLTETHDSANVGCLECRNAGSQPIVSSNGTTTGTIIVWALKTADNDGGNITLYAFDGASMATLYNGVAGVWTHDSNASYIGGALVSPTVANGRVYVPTDGAVGVFGLSQ